MLNGEWVPCSTLVNACWEAGEYYVVAVWAIADCMLRGESKEDEGLILMEVSTGRDSIHGRYEQAGT